MRAGTPANSFKLTQVSCLDFNSLFVVVKTLNQRVRDRYTYLYLSCPWLQTFLCISLRRHAHRPLAKRLMHMAHLAGNTSGVSKSSSDCLDYTGFPGDECVVFFNIPLGNKNAVMPNLPHERRKPPCLQLMTSAGHACLDQLNAGFSKVCEKNKICGIESLKYVWEFYTWRHFHSLKHIYIFLMFTNILRTLS